MEGNAHLGHTYSRTLDSGHVVYKIIINFECESCSNCQDMRKFGGPGKKKQCCVKRKCKPAPPLAHTHTHTHTHRHIHTRRYTHTHTHTPETWPIHICTGVRLKSTASKHNVNSNTLNLPKYQARAFAQVNS